MSALWPPAPPVMETGRRVTPSPSPLAREGRAGLAPGGSDHPQGGRSVSQHPPWLEPLGHSPRGPERAGRPLGLGSELQGHAGSLAAAAGAVAGGRAAGQGARPEASA